MRGVAVKAVLVGIGSLAAAHGAQAEGPPPSSATPAMASTVLVAAVPLAPALERVEFTPPAPPGDDPFNRVKGALRHRFASKMMDLYPSAESGFHLSFGTRFFAKQYIRRDQQLATNGLLYEPRMPRGGYGQRGFRRATAAATVGYTQTVRSNLMFGLEGGTLLGRAVQAPPRLLPLTGEGRDRSDSRRQLNPVLNLTVAYAF